MLKQLREQVLEANLEVVRRGLVLYTFGNVSGISREDNLVAIKPSGGIGRQAWAQATACSECVCTTPPICGKAL